MKDSRIWIIFLIGLFLYCINSGDRLNNDVVVIETDTTRVTWVDTIYFVDTIIHKLYIKINTPVIINDSTKEYVNDFSDSLLTGSVWTSVNGKMLDQKINYIPRFPQYIIQTDTVIINIKQTTIRQPSDFSLNVGVEVGGNDEKFNFSPTLGFTNKQNSYFYRYGVIDKTHNVGVVYKFKIK
tara:strand:- start:10385 stop:10930 length:546 start_codon:yes stop_codon:yes gene_type:complete